MKHVSSDLKIVVVGGGSGSFVALRAARQLSSHVTAVVTMFDSGGSSGVIRNEFNVLPPGDVRRCLVALASGAHEKTFEQLFDFRFRKNSSLNGHNFGNLFLLALAEITGSMAEGIRVASSLLNVQGRVLPVSVEQATLCARLEDGQEIVGELNIDIPKHDGSLAIKQVYLNPSVTIFPEAEQALLDADIIIIGPGDLYTSIIPNLLARGFSHALRHSRAKKICIPNLMTKWGETNDYSVSMFVRELLKYSGIKKFDYLLYNKRIPPKRLLVKYAKEKQFPFVPDLGGLKNLANEIIVGDFVHENDYVRHDAAAIATALRRVVIQKTYLSYSSAPVFIQSKGR
jgi:uncharacterized cofD-like protein